jgi:hypothetical protein
MDAECHTPAIGESTRFSGALKAACAPAFWFTFFHRFDGLVAPTSMAAIEMLPVVLGSMVLGASVGWFCFHDFYHGTVIGFIASFVLVGMVGLGAAAMRRVREAAAARRTANR